MTAIYTLPLPALDTALGTVGGKGLSLARLARAGLPVPDGFHILTAAYRDFVALGSLQEQIAARLAGLDTSDPAACDVASAQIGALFERAPLPAEIVQAVRAAYQCLGSGDVAVAVRSSATAEDLPEASFAGQQETYLNICGADAVLAAVRRCWASLWTARAISYRAKNGVSSDTVALAVVIQTLIPADAAGVLFTANPLSGRRGELVINAAWGLGEALVGGQVSPDTLVVDKRSGRLRKTSLADKTVMTVAEAQGTREAAVPQAQRRARVLSNGEVRQLAGLAGRIEALFGAPQDIEWCRSEGRFYIVQSRPITNLPPDWPVPYKKMMYARSSLVEFLPGPLSPLFETLGVEIANESAIAMFKMVTDGRWKKDLYTIINGYLYAMAPMGFRDMLIYAGMTTKMTGMVLRGGEPRWREGLAAYRAAVGYWSLRPLADMPPAELLEMARELMKEATDYFSVVQSTTIPLALMAEMTLTQLYNRLVRRKGEPGVAALLVGSETEALRAEKALYALGGWLRERPALADWLRAVPARAAAEQLAGGKPPARVNPQDWAEWLERLRAYQESWGHQLYDFDFASPLPAEDPLPMLEALQNYLAGLGVDPSQRQAGQIERREQLCAAINRRLDPLRRRWFNQALANSLKRNPLREDSIAAMGLGYPLLRRALSELGGRLVRAGGLGQSEDIYWLRKAELEEAIRDLEQGQPLPRLDAVIAARKAGSLRLRRIIPPPILPRNTMFQAIMPMDETRQTSQDSLKGIGASAGSVTAPACVLFGPEDFGRMRAGDVLVAVTTTPAWTPLFALASAVVTDIGGPLSHSSIMAREYGIPAVMATGAATRRIRSGQLLTVDGAQGVVKIHSG